jgi:serine phosphatase RsbU (regulator of sigma subunit)
LTLLSEDERERRNQSEFSPSAAVGKRAITLVPVRPGPADTAALAGEAANAPGAWFEALLDAVPTPLVLVEPAEGRTLFVNAAARALAGGELPPLPLERIAAGERLDNAEIAWAGPDGPRTLLVSTASLAAQQGGPAMSVITFEDVSDLRAAQREAAFLARAGEILGASLDIDETFARLAELVVPHRADWCAIDVRELNGDLRRVADHGADPGAVEGFDAVLASGEPLVRDGALVVAMRVRGIVVGAITLAVAGEGRRFGNDDLALMRDVARRASTAIENAGLHGQMLYIARTLQSSLLPPQLPEIPGFELATRYRAAGEGIEVGGDFYDVFRRAEGEWAFVLGDVVGKGPPAAALTAMARYTMRAAALEHPQPSQVLGLLNDALLREDAPDRLMSAIQGRLVLGGEAPVLTVAEAGHPPLLLARGGRVEPLLTGGRLLGVLPAAELEDRSLTLEPGDTIVLYTDGLTDAGAPARLLKIPDLARAVERVAGRSAEEIAASLEDLAVQAGGGSPRDDLAIVVLRYVG